jgi:hypothetical protein
MGRAGEEQCCGSAEDVNEKGAGPHEPAPLKGLKSNDSIIFLFREIYQKYM